MRGGRGEAEEKSRRCARPLWSRRTACPPLLVTLSSPPLSLPPPSANPRELLLLAPPLHSPSLCLALCVLSYVIRHTTHNILLLCGATAKLRPLFPSLHTDRHRHTHTTSRAGFFASSSPLSPPTTHRFAFLSSFFLSAPAAGLSAPSAPKRPHPVQQSPSPPVRPRLLPDRRRGGWMKGVGGGGGTLLLSGVRGLSCARAVAPPAAAGAQHKRGLSPAFQVLSFRTPTTYTV